MQLGIVGFGRMGSGLARRLERAGHAVVAYDRKPKEGRNAATLEELVAKLEPPRAVWVMLPAGPPTETTLDALAPLLSAGDCLIDGGNSRCQDDAPRAARLAQRGLDYLDIGVSGGVWGLQEGFCMMVGGEKRVVDRLAPLLDALGFWLHCGAVGTGHFTKMVHNGVEYGIMEAYAEGFELLHARGLDAAKIAELWRHASVVRSWLLDLGASALAEDPKLEAYSAAVKDSGEGRWTIEAALEAGVPVEVISAALSARLRSRGAGQFGDRFLSALRNKFGGHQ